MRNRYLLIGVFAALAACSSRKGEIKGEGEAPEQPSAVRAGDQPTHPGASGGSGTPYIPLPSGTGTQGGSGGQSGDGDSENLIPSFALITGTFPDTLHEEYEFRLVGRSHSAVTIHLGVDCLAPAIKAGSAAEFSAGIEIAVPIPVIKTEIRARNELGCSPPYTFERMPELVAPSEFPPLNANPSGVFQSAVQLGDRILTISQGLGYSNVLLVSSLSSRGHAVPLLDPVSGQPFVATTIAPIRTPDGEFAVFSGYVRGLSGHLFITDGTSAGTRHLDIGVSLLHADNMMSFGSFVVFGSNVGTKPYYATNGTVEGTSLIASGSQLSPNNNFAADTLPNDSIKRHDKLGSKGLFFVRNTQGSPVRGIVVTDGTPDGTSIITSMPAGYSLSQLSTFSPKTSELGGYVYFTANDANNRPQLLRTDGASVELFRDFTAVNTGGFYTKVSTFFSHAGKLFINVSYSNGLRSGLYVSNGVSGSAPDTVAVSTTPFVGLYGVSPIGDERLIALGYRGPAAQISPVTIDLSGGITTVTSAGNAGEIFASNDNPANVFGERLLYDSHDGKGYWNIESATIRGGAVTRALLVSDGTTDGTRVLRASPNGSGSYVRELFVLKGSSGAVYRTSDSHDPTAFYITNGTDEGTRKLTTPRYGDFSRNGLGRIAGKLLLVRPSSPEVDFELVAYDTASSSEHVIASAAPVGYKISRSEPFTNLGGVVIYKVANSLGHVLLYATDGDTAWRVHSTVTTAPTDSVFALGTKAVFMAGTGATGAGNRRLYISDGTEAGTSELLATTGLTVVRGDEETVYLRTSLGTYKTTTIDPTNLTLISASVTFTGMLAGTSDGIIFSGNIAPTGNAVYFLRTGEAPVSLASGLTVVSVVQGHNGKGIFFSRNAQNEILLHTSDGSVSGTALSGTLGTQVAGKTFAIDVKASTAGGKIIAYVAGLSQIPMMVALDQSNASYEILGQVPSTNYGYADSLDRTRMGVISLNGKYVFKGWLDGTGDEASYLHLIETDGTAAGSKILTGLRKTGFTTPLLGESSLNASGASAPHSHVIDGRLYFLESTTHGNSGLFRY